MNWKITIGAIVVALAVSGAFFAFKNTITPANISNSQPNTNKGEGVDLPSKPWLEVIKPAVIKIGSQGETGSPLKTGDEVEPGTTIQTDRQGLAAIHFPDGSILRVDSETKLTVTGAEFDARSEKLSVKIVLASGRLWSKILSLVTADSSWEVKTTNAVATVRGTAFGFAFASGRSRILGSENTTVVNAIDPAASEIIKTDVGLTADKYIEIRDADIKNYLQNPKLLAARDAPAEILNQEWVKRYKAEDKEYNSKFDEIKRESGLEGRELRDFFRQKIYKEFESKIKAGSEEAVSTPSPSAAPTTGEKPKAQSQSAPGKTATAEKADVIVKGSLDNAVEGDQIIFQAAVTLSDGTKRDITGEAEWQVIGPIGKMVKPGVFEAKLDDSVSELGSASGTVIATWQDKLSGDNFLLKSPIFKVRAKVEADTNRDG